MLWVKIKKLHPNAVIPSYATPMSAGMDISCLQELRLMPNHTEVVKTGLAVEIPKGYELQIRPRSGLAAKYGITVTNSPGTIDADYRGEICVLLRSPVPIDFPAGTRIAQLVPQQVPHLIFQDVDELSETERGEGGFGSTGS